MNSNSAREHDVLQLLFDLGILTPNEVYEWQLSVLVHEFLKHRGISNEEIRKHLDSIFV